MCIFDGSHVELPEIYAKAETAVLFLDHHHWRGPRAVGGTNDAAH